MCLKYYNVGFFDVRFSCLRSWFRTPWQPCREQHMYTSWGEPWLGQIAWKNRKIRQTPSNGDA